MTLEQKNVYCFMSLAKQSLPDKPTFPDQATRDLRLDLHYEEAVKELRDAFKSKDLTFIADSLVDSLYVIYGTANACGLDLEPFFAEVHRSNMTKFIDGLRAENGKWVKGPSYTPASLQPILEAQIKGK